MIGGGLFSRYYLDEGVRLDPIWRLVDDTAVLTFRALAQNALSKVPADGKLGEAETEALIIFPVLAALGWAHLPQQKGTSRREDVLDALLFLTAERQKEALAFPAGYERWKKAALLNENKAWGLPLDRASGKITRTPASQALRYLRLGDEHTGGILRWALLTNGCQWRLYFAGASSMADRFLEMDLPALLEGADTPEGIARLRSFMLFFRPAAFSTDAVGRSFLLAAMEDGRKWQERVTADLSRAVFQSVYPALLKALGDADPSRKPDDASWPEVVRENAVVLLYRLLFLLYAEDRDLLPVDHKGYRPRSLARLRHEVAEALDEKRVLSTTDAFWWGSLKALFNAVDKGSDAMGLPAYNGGLFDPREAPMLQSVALPDESVAAILDGLSRRQEHAEKRNINYRDLSVQQLGAIYERLLDFDVELDDAGAVVLTKDSIARKESGSFYTPPSLVSLILDATIGPQISASRDRFKTNAEALCDDRRPVGERIADLRRSDPAEALLDLKLVDPAMGSGHFLVSVVDRLADAVLLAMDEAAVIAEQEARLSGYTSPLADRIESERARIEAVANKHGWPYRPEHLDDRHLVRRLVLKRAVYGVDQNRLAVELAKLSLWLHSFTVGAPLSFLDHHLRHGDSLFGAWVADSLEELQKRGSMFLYSAVESARGAAAGMARIEDLADADLSQVMESKEIFETVEEATAPLRAFFDCWHALLWLPPAGASIPSGPTKRAAVKLAEATRKGMVDMWLDGLCGDPVALASGEAAPKDQPNRPGSGKALGEFLAELRAIAQRERLFHWQPAFPGVWREWREFEARGGFDAVVGNPPWVRQETIAAKKPVLKDHYKTYEGKADLSTFFLEQAQRLVRPGGRVAFVLPNKFFKADYGEPLRTFLAEETWIESVVDFGHNRDLFPDADVFPCVLVTRRPDPAADPVADAAVAVIPGDRVPQENLPALLKTLQFPMPRISFAREGWVLEPPAVLSFLERLQQMHPNLVEVTGQPPQYGLKTGLNEAFVVNTATRDQLVAADPTTTPIFRKFLRGGDIERWVSPWPGQWMILLRSSADYAWPWAQAPDAQAAETIFKSTYPALHARLSSMKSKLENREDQGRFWWELRPCAYYGAFEQPKIIYQVIQFHAAYSIDHEGYLLNDKGFMINTADPFILAALNSPLLWWYGWRHFPHMKDEALNPAAFKMERLPIARPSAQQAEEAAILTAKLAATHRSKHTAASAIADWLRIEWGIAAPPVTLSAPFGLSADRFAEALRANLPKKRKLTVAEIAAIKDSHAQMIAPVAERLNEAAQLERELSAVVNAAYGLTPEEEALVWRTAPPRMPITPPETAATA